VTCGDGGNSFACTMQGGLNTPSMFTGPTLHVYQRKSCTNLGAGDKLGCLYHHVEQPKPYCFLKCFCQTDLCNKEKDYGSDIPNPNGAPGTRNTVSTMLCVGATLIGKVIVLCLRL